MKNSALNAATAFSIAVGAVGLIGSVSIYWFLLYGDFYSTPVIGPLFKTFVGLTLYIGIFVVVASIIHLVAGLLLLKRKKMGGYLGLALSASEVLSYLATLFSPILVLPMIALLGIGSVFSILLVAAWDGLG